jgi:trimeric autotransporter adhesin
MTVFKALSLGCVILLSGVDGCGSAGKGTVPPSPNISIAPTSAVVGSADLVLTVTGTNFANADHDKSSVMWSVDGVDTSLSTTFVSSSQLTAVIPAALMASPTTANVLVESGDPGGSLPPIKSDLVTFSVTAAKATVSISSVSPMSAVAGSLDLMITVSGSNFANSLSTNNFNTSTVVWSVNGVETNLHTTFVSRTQLTAVIPALFLANPVTADVLVETGDPISSIPFSKSNSISFVVNPP